MGLAVLPPFGGKLHQALKLALQARLRFGSLDLDRASPPLLLAGPPGAGKTLTAARLATRLVRGQ